MRLAWGGTVNIEYPKYSDVAHGLLRELGIDIPRLRKDFDFNWLGIAGRAASRRCCSTRRATAATCCCAA